MIEIRKIYLNIEKSTDKNYKNKALVKSTWIQKNLLTINKNKALPEY